MIVGPGVDAPLIDAWLAEAERITTSDEGAVAAACALVRARGAAVGLPPAVVERAALVAGALGDNQLSHARLGQLGVRAVTRGAVPGLEIIAADLGPGLADPRRALEGRGVSTARRLADELDVDVRWGEGSCLRARAFALGPQRRREVGVLGRPCAGELQSGDHAVCRRDGDSLLFAVIDGIGHGPLAFEAADRAAATALERHGLSPAGVLAACDAALDGTRGVVMAVVHLDDELGTLEHAAVGNVTTRLEGYGRTRSLAGTSSALGPRSAWRRPAVTTAELERGEAILLFTDGISSRATLAGDPDILREHPVVIAQHVLAGFGRTTDDALVLVAR